MRTFARCAGSADQHDLWASRQNWRTILLFIFAVLRSPPAAPDALHRILGI